MASAVDPAMVRFTSAYRRSAGFAPYESKLSEAERDVMAAEAAHAGSGGGASAHGGGGGGGGGGGRSPPRSPPRQNSLALPPPMAATTTSFAEIKAYRDASAANISRHLRAGAAARRSLREARRGADVHGGTGARLADPRRPRAPLLPFPLPSSGRSGTWFRSTGQRSASTSR